MNLSIFFGLLFGLSPAVLAKSLGDTDFGECKDVVLTWEKKEWGPDLEGHILVKAKGSPALEDGWSVTIELDQPVTQCVDYNANMTKARIYLQLHTAFFCLLLK